MSKLNPVTPGELLLEEFLKPGLSQYRLAEDVVELHDRLGRNRHRSPETDDAVARAVVDTHPQVALDIWRDRIDRAAFIEESLKHYGIRCVRGIAPE